MNKFKVISDFTPQGDQPKAIQNLKNGVTKGLDYQTLMGITGAGKSANCLAYRRVANALPCTRAK